MTAITKVLAREILDSRGNPTLEVEMHAGSASAVAMVPSGASTGRHEAHELRDGGSRLFGRGVRKAAANVQNVIAPKLTAADCENQEAIDATLIELDGTPDKSNLGANALVGVSMAAARLAALVQGKQLFAYLYELYYKETASNYALPCPQLNIINGGRHAGSKLAVQEFMLIPHRAAHFSEALFMAADVYQHLKQELKLVYGSSSINVGDEGGFVPHIDSTEKALEVIAASIEELGYQDRIGLGLDCAASSFYDNGTYLIEGRKSAEELLDFYASLIETFPIISVEDPFDEEDFASFAAFTRAHRKLQVVGDDLLTTNVKRIDVALQQQSCNALLLKVNQIGTVTEALAAAKRAFGSTWRVVVSHRSGETEDTFIADLAVGLGCGQIKTGAPARAERAAKYNRLLRIEEMLGERATFASPFG
ncbi:MAG: phosphopyruvate hydratase [Candidatus Aenigmarchaeota archaeon]|nr:phosphopyruvate hydratase [Candidatus Aenigmarchaeota archaeon]